MTPTTPLFRLKRNARLLARRECIALNEALDRVAAAEGFASWSLLAAKAPSPAERLYGQLASGDMVLIGARPGQGKTLMGLKLALEAVKAGRDSLFFSLEYAERDVSERMRKLGADKARLAGRFTFDGSDDICADHIIAKLTAAPEDTLAVVDYLQLLDQKRTNPPLDEQLRTLRAFARERQLVFVFLSQIDRSYDARTKPFPDLGDIRQPNPFDLSLFARTCFLNEGRMRLRAAA